MWDPSYLIKLGGEGGGLRLLCMLSELQGVCEGVTVEREKSILKQGAIQHLYGRLSGRLREGVNDASLLVSLIFAPPSA